MKKIIACSLAICFLMPAIALADDASSVVPPVATINDSDIIKIENTSVIDTIDSLANWFLTALLIVAVWFFIFAAFNFVTANGETEKVTKARNQLMYGIIGVLVGVMAKGLVSFVAGMAKR
jgi:hypothetical protein